MRPGTEHTFEIAGYTCIAWDSHDGWCGYVGIPYAHPWYELDYERIDADVHGGLTYSDFRSGPGGLWFVGFDCMHYGDQANGRVGPTLKVWTLDLVRAELASLAYQAKAAAK